MAASNTLLTIDMITREALRVLRNQLTFTRNVNREYDSSFAKSGAKIGQTLRIRLPNAYIVRSGKTFSAQDTAEIKVDLTVDQQIGVDIEFSSVEQTMSLDDFSKRVLEPALSVVSNKIDADGLALYKDIYSHVGAPGTDPNTALTLLQSQQKLNEKSAPLDESRFATFNPAGQVSMVDALKGFFHAGQKISDQFKNGLMANGILGFNMIGMDQNVATHTVGKTAGTPLVDDTVASGDSSVNIDGWTEAADVVLTQGDVFTIAGVFAVNPVNKATLPVLQQFVVTADATTASNQVEVAVSPSFISTGARQNISALPADDAAVTVVGSAEVGYAQNLAYHRNAFTLGMADLEMPPNVAGSRAVDDGISVRIVQQYQLGTDITGTRLDVLYGWATIRPELACRIVGA